MQRTTLPFLQKVNGVSMHPKFGGWFALRGVIIFKQLRCEDLCFRAPPDCVPIRDDQIRLLEKFNYYWKDWSYRDIVPSETKYSEQQKQYFALMPKYRFVFLDEILSICDR